MILLIKFTIKIIAKQVSFHELSGIAFTFSPTS